MPRTASQRQKSARGDAVKNARALVRRAASGTLLAASLAAAKLDAVELTEKWRIFSPHLVDRLQAPLTRYHE